MMIPLWLNPNEYHTRHLLCHKSLLGVRCINLTFLPLRLRPSFPPSTPLLPLVYPTVLLLLLIYFNAFIKTFLPRVVSRPHKYNLILTQHFLHIFYSSISIYFSLNIISTFNFYRNRLLSKIESKACFFLLINPNVKITKLVNIKKNFFLII